MCQNLQPSSVNSTLADTSLYYVRPDIKDTCESAAKTIINCIAIALAIYNIADT